MRPAACCGRAGRLGGFGVFGPRVWRGRFGSTRPGWLAIPVLLALLPSLLQGCAPTEVKSATKSDRLASPAVPRDRGTAKGDRLVPDDVRMADGSRTQSRQSFADRFPAQAFPDRYPTQAFADRYPQQALVAPSRRGGGGERTGSLAPGSYRVASLSPELPADLPVIKQAQTRLVGFENSAFPYFGSNPRSGRDRWEQARYSDNRVLVHVPEGFDVRKPGVIVVFFHGHGATLERDIRDRQLVPRQISESGANAVLLAPQLAVDAADSSAGKFWEPGGLKRFLAESAEHLARIYGDPRAAKAFSTMPVVIVAYSGGFVPAAYSLNVGGLGNRVRGVILLDALYGEMDKFTSWIANNRSAFFVSAYTHSTRRHNDELIRILSDKGLAITRELDGRLKPGTLAFLATGEGIRHRDYVTLAWTEHPVTDVLERMVAR
jgi:hypothetical protein